MNRERRHFLKMAGYGLGGTALAAMIDRLGLSAALAQQPPAGDYKALVCIFLNGGNDANNMVIPINTTNANLNYTKYSAVRSGNGLAIAQSALSNTMISGSNIPSSTFALHPAFASTTGGNPLYPLWGSSKLAIVANVGPLAQPLTKADYQNPQKSKPYQLFSHSDQQEIWQTAQALRRVPNGWAGRIADNAASQTFPVNTSISGFPVFTKGANSGPLVVNDSRTHLNQLLVISGQTSNSNDDKVRISTLMEFTGIDLGNNYLLDSASSITAQTINIAANFNVPDPTINTVFPPTTLGYQLLQVARIIKVATDNSLASRHIFFCQLGGFDSHTNELPTHNNLYPQVSQAMRAFYDCTVELGLANQVTTCTMSDFGRTYQPSGSGGGVGSDHGWGSHQLVLGGAVKGKNFWGVRRADLGSDPVAIFPILDGSANTKGLGGNSDTDTGSNPRGRWIPTVAVEQYAATLAKWFGLSATNMPYVFPNLTNFAVSDLGFLNAG